MHLLMKFSPIVLLLALFLAVLPSSLAQDDNPTLGLSDEDYDFLQQAIENTDEADSFQLTYSASLSLTDSTTGDQTLEVAGSGSITHDDDEPTIAITSSGTSANMGTLPASFNREAVYIDGFGYSNLIDLSSGDGPGWQGLAIDNIFSGAYNLALILVDPSALTSPDVNDLINITNGINSLELRPYISVTRNEDADIKGETLAHFTAVLDTDSLFESPEFAQVLIDILASAGEDPGISDDQLTAAGILIGSMFRGSALTVELYVDNEGYLSATTADVTLTIDPTKLGGEGSPTSAHLILDFSLSGFDGDYPVEAPVDATIVEAQNIPTPAPISDGDTLTAGNPVVVDLSGSVNFVYNAANPETVTVIARSLDGTLDTILDVYNADGTLIGSNDDATIALPNLSLTDSVISNLNLPAAGVYTIHLDSFSGASTGQVELTITSAALQIITQDLNGKALFVTEPLKVYMTGLESIDFLYQVNGSEAVSVYVTNLDTNPELIDTTLEILDENGGQLAFNDDLSDADVNPGIENLELDPGIYTIRLNPYDEDQVGGVQVELVTGEVKATGDGGDSQSGESILNFGDSITGTITDSSTGEYNFDGSEGQIITITVEASNPSSPDQDLEITLYDSEGDEIASDDDSGESLGFGGFDPAIIEFSIPYNDTFLVVVDSIFDVSGDYTISLQEN
jgi:hypothetical protein